MPSITTPASSVAGVVSFLEFPDVNLQLSALKRLYKLVDVHWAEICDALPQLTVLAESSEKNETTTPTLSQYAAAVASHCFYHLGEYNDALRMAMDAGPLFDVSSRSEYIDIMLSKLIDEYTTLRQAQVRAMNAILDAQMKASDSEGGIIAEITSEQRADALAAASAEVEIDPRMEGIVENMFLRCYRDGCFDQAVGIALETQRLDKLNEVFTEAINAGRESVLGYAFRLCQSSRSVHPREFRLTVIEQLVKLYSTLPEPDYTNMVYGLLALDRPEPAGLAFSRLLNGSDREALLALQIAFDLVETEYQGFILRVTEFIPATAAEAVEKNGGTGVAVDEELYATRLAKLKRILCEGLDVDMTLSFLFKAAHTDLNGLREIKKNLEPRYSVLHHATVMSHSYLQAGTTRDTFLRDNLDWLGKAKHWARFSTVASIGVVHKGHVHESMALLQPYLPSATTVAGSPSSYSEAGALYALGLIHANKGGSGDSATITYLQRALGEAANDEVRQHGACLGIGLAAMATADEGLIETLRNVLFEDSAIGGEAAALGIGLVALGQAGRPSVKAVLPDLINYLHDTTHEKISRALALSVAMMVYGQEEAAETLIETLLRDRDPIVRYGGAFAVAMAYIGTADNASLRRLLHVAVSDVNDDVRRAAVISIGFLLFRTPEIVPRTVALLAESFNPHVRYGACMAIAVGCAGSALPEALELLLPLLEDSVDFVRQGAMLAMAFVLQQASEARTPAFAKFKADCRAVLNDKHRTVLSKSGALYALGILEAGGGNVVVSLASRAGFVKMGSAVGMLLFLQHWYWYPLMPFLSLTFTPTLLMGLDKDLALPAEFALTCHAPASMFAYAKHEDKSATAVEAKTVKTAVLSTTARTKAREARKEARRLARQSSLDSEGVPIERATSLMSVTSHMSAETGSAVGGPTTTEKPKKVREPTSFTITNPSRVVPAQQRFLSAVTTENGEKPRYTPVRTRGVPVGFVILEDNQPEEPSRVVRLTRVSLGQVVDADPPAAFAWDPTSLA